VGAPAERGGWGVFQGKVNPGVNPSTPEKHRVTGAVMLMLSPTATGERWGFLGDEL